MTEKQPEYTTESDVTDALEMLGKGYEPAVIIERPRKAHGINSGGLEEFQLAGWVKMSAKFCTQIKRLRGAKLAIWLCLALVIDEEGRCSLTQKELTALTGYSHTEVIDSVGELGEMGLLSVDRSGKRNLYQPAYVAKGKGNNPTVKKLDSTGADSLESSRQDKKSVPTSSKKKQEGVPPIVFDKANKTVDGILQATLSPKAVQDAVRDHFRLTPRWENKYEREWMQWAMEAKVTPEQVKAAADLWRMDKRFNWQAPNLKGIHDHWLGLTEAQVSTPAIPKFIPPADDEKKFIPNPNPRRYGSPE
jgi:hypothetical protein